MKFRVFFEKPQFDIAAMTQNAANFVSTVIVIRMPTLYRARIVSAANHAD